MDRNELVLISHKLCPYVQRARIVLDEKRIAHELRFIDLAAKPPWFRRISPLGRVPVLLVDDRPLFESAVIVEFLDELAAPALHPTDRFERARNRSWMEFASSTLGAISAFYNATDRAGFERAIDTLRGRFQRLERELGAGPHFNGAPFSLVDASFGPVFRYFEVVERYADLGLFEGLPRVVAWRRALHGRPSVERAVVADYHERLHRFFLARDSVLSRIAAGHAAA